MEKAAASIVTDRRSLLGGAAAALLPAPPWSAVAVSPSNPNELWLAQPATEWVEGLPVGNGRLGAMIFGRVGQERLQLNEDTLWAGGPYDPVNPEAHDALPKVRALIEQERFAEAAELAQAKMMGKPLRQMPYGTLGDFMFDFTDAQAPLAYRRSLDLGEAIAVTAYRDGRGNFRREIFASAVDQVVVVRMEAKGQRARLNFDLRHRAPEQGRYQSWDNKAPASALKTGPVDWLHRDDPPARSETPVQVDADGPGALLVSGMNRSANGVDGKLRYAMRVAALSDGRVSAGESGMSVRDARQVTLLIAAATNYRGPNDLGGDPIGIVRGQTEAARKRSYSALRTAHVASHRALFDRMDVQLGDGAANPLPTDERVVRSVADDPALAALYLQYARYLMICSSRPGCQPANLQGLWNEGTNPPWDSKYTININTEMNYWLVGPGGLTECAEPLLRMVEELAVTGAGTARRMYGARGWMCHHNTDLWRASAPIDGVTWGLWPTGGAWLCVTLWSIYDYKPDPLVLKRLYPLLRGASLFFLDALVEDPKGRGLVTSPTLSPENSHLPGLSICAGAAMDRQIVRDLLDATLAAAREIGADDDMAPFAAARARLAPDRIGAQGQLQEWLDDWDARAPEQQHRHVSHLYAVYPSEQINIERTPALARAAAISLDHRGDEATGWGTAWRSILWARLGDAERAHKILAGLIGPQRTYATLLDSCPPFQIDGNFGGAVAIMEMLLQSWGGQIRLLPALPSAWPNGRVRGLAAKGGVLVDMEWRDSTLRHVAVRGAAGQRLVLRNRDRTADITLDRLGRFVATEI